MINVSWFNGLVARSLQWVWGGGPSSKPIFEVGMGANLLDHEIKKDKEKKNHDWLDFDAPNLDFLKNF